MGHAICASLAFYRRVVIRRGERAPRAANCPETGETGETEQTRKTPEESCQRAKQLMSRASIITHLNGIALPDASDAGWRAYMYCSGVHILGLMCVARGGETSVRPSHEAAVPSCTALVHQSKPTAEPASPSIHHYMANQSNSPNAEINESLRRCADNAMQQPSRGTRHVSMLGSSDSDAALPRNVIM